LKISDSLSWGKALDVTGRHGLPHEVVSEVPRGVGNSVVSLHVCIEALIVEHAVDSAIESVDAGIVLLQLGSGQALPEIYLAWFSSCSRSVTGQDPSMRSFLVGTDADKGVKAEAQQ
jgi:hypothetical protein